MKLNCTILFLKGHHFCRRMLMVTKLAICILLVNCLQANANEEAQPTSLSDIHGTVTDSATGKALQGVNIRVKNGTGRYQHR